VDSLESELRSYVLNVREKLSEFNAYIFLVVNQREVRNALKLRLIFFKKYSDIYEEVCFSLLGLNKK